MSEHDLFGSVELAHSQLAALRSRVDQDGAAPARPEIASALLDLQGVLDKLHGRFGLLCEILDLSKAVVFAKDRDGRYAMINSRGAEMLGRTVAEVLGADDRALFENVDAERIMAIDREVMSTGQSRTREEKRDFRGVRTTLLTTTNTWFDADRRVRGVLGIAQGFAGHRGSERDGAVHHDRMRSMATEMVINEERLRRSLATELHNGLGQDIALAKLKLSMLRSSTGVDLHDPLKDIEQLIERVDRSLRSIAFQMSPPSLHDLGLVAALEWLGEDIGRKYGIGVRLEDDDSPGVADGRVRVILFRAVRELLVNAATHAGVSEATVHVDPQGGDVRITVADSGNGFDTADLDQRGYGLFGIGEQLKYVEGSMHIDSCPGRGTTVTLSAPASAPKARVTA
jgi:PAS domain S-box-containing protein